MLFNSVEFFIFLPIVFLLYWLVFGKNVRLQNLFIVVVSYLFYAWWNWKFAFLIAFTTGCSFINGVAIRYYKEKNKKQIAKFISNSNVVINLLILAIFKYYNFFADSLVFLMGTMGVVLDYPTLNIILPVGISFYTFQALSYTIDVQRDKIMPTKDPIQFFAFISFFPQLVAGPIERAENLLPQFKKERYFNYLTAVDGCRQMLWGFFKKIVIADNCAYYANIAFNNHNDVGSLSLLLGAIFFTIQIYGDFSGYSSIAIGCAKLFGIKLQANFKVPYFSRDISEFWKRWHISLNKWFVDYVYIPLGGSRVPKNKIIRNTFIIFLLSGLWHGANWTYVAWGLYHACLFLPLILLNKNHKYKQGFDENKKYPSFQEVINMVLTFGFVMIGWIIFRSTSITNSIQYIIRMFSFVPDNGKGISTFSVVFIFLTIIVFIVEWWNRNEEHEFKKIIFNKSLRMFVYFLLTASIYISFLISIRSENTFIYFQF